MSALLPLYLKTYFADEALFNESKIVTSIYDNGFQGSLDNKLFDKIKFDIPDEKRLETLKESTHFSMQKIAIENSDAVVYGSAVIPTEIEQFIQQTNKKVLPYYSLENIEEPITSFYLNQVLQ